jgi:hypothetical protein
MSIRHPLIGKSKDKKLTLYFYKCKIYYIYRLMDGVMKIESRACYFEKLIITHL